MSNSIISNIAAFNAQGNIGRASASAAASIARLSSGNRIAKASDDVSGLATGTALRTQVTTLRQALSNVTQGSSLLQVADGGLGQIVDILQRQKAIATQASSGQLTDTNRSLLNQEFQNLTQEIDRIANSTNFNGVGLLSGGLGSKTTLERTDALAVTASPAAGGQGGTGGVASTVAIQAFSTTTGTAALANNPNTTIGNLTVTDSAGTLLTNAAYLGVDTNLWGQFSGFSLSNVNYGANGTATVTATINGSTYTGTVTAGANATAILQNGNTYIKVGLGTVTLTDSASTSNTQALINNGFKNTYIAKTDVVQGVNFNGTALTGAVGSGTQFVTARLANNGDANISNFTYVSNNGAANGNTISVTVNGQTFTSTGVADTLTSAGGSILFKNNTGLETLTVNLAGLGTTTGNIRTDVVARATVLAAFNAGFSKAGGNGLNFSIGSLATDTINVSLSSANTVSLYNGNALDVSTAANAATASAQLDLAINKATSLRASVGALESRFNFASNAVQSAIENQDAARSQLLDTDVSAESTAYASAQVQTQAGIAVLAQANQLPQALLKLIQ